MTLQSDTFQKSSLIDYVKTALVAVPLCGATPAALAAGEQPAALPAEVMKTGVTAADRVRFQLPVLTVDKALVEFSRQSRAQVVLASGVSVTGLMSVAVSGEWSPAQALNRLLEGSGLTVQETLSGDFLITAGALPVRESVVEELVVTATRSTVNIDDLPQVVTVIPRQQIEQQLRLTSDTSQVLSNLLPAFTPNRQKLTNSGETFRGRAPLLLIDGVPQSNPLRSAGRAGHTIDLAVVERIEVIHGASAIHGLGATGGIINYITRRPESDSFKQHINLQSGFPASGSDSDAFGYKASYGFEGAQDNAEYLFGASYQDQGVYLDADGDLVGVDNTQGDLMDSTTYDLFAKVGYWFNSEQHLGVEINRYESEGNLNYISVAGDRDQGIASSSVKGTPVGLAPRNRVLTASINYQDKNLFGMQFSAQMYSQQFEGRFGAVLTRTFQDTAIAPDGELYDQSQTRSDKLGAKLTLSKDNLLDSRLKVTGGVDILTDTTDQTLELTGRTWVPESTFNNYAPFLQTELRPIDSVILHAGIRHEKAELDVDSFRTVASANSVFVEGGKPEFSETLLSAGTVINPLDGVSLFANYSEGFGMPDVGRVLRGIREPDQSVAEFLNLEPVLTENTEFGIRMDYQSVNIELSYYQSDSDFGARLQQIDGIYFVRRQKTEIDGYEANITLQANDRHKFSVAYSKINGEFDSNGDGKVDARLNGLNIPPNRLIASWAAQWSGDLVSTVQVSHAFDRRFDNPDLTFNGYSLVDLTLGYQLPKGQLSLAVGNALNKDYITYYSQSAIVNDARYFNGRGRNISLTYNLDF